MSTDRYAKFVKSQAVKVDRTGQLERFRRRLRWWAITLAVATVLFSILLVVGELR